MAPQTKRYLNEIVAAQIVGLSPRTLQRMRHEGWGIPYCRMGLRRIVYDADEIEKWATGRTFRHRAAELAKQVAA
ncbi:helix-turn-helix transcriptional regulator [Limobrevibacterium gyesilva]|uniref:Helix-turn-helix domain-containing protein n=1 Tax=Limobrevibacterium gyesilva TaxID=2991712 RepID=A0AA42CF99_9PROT|nr:helix-turn-helix domain-containing protein [Limobrevibacterium gyesilva]MCW3476329.1 helix-turn-helix domain-containing protein [Limobrevibacterium gyesilva]